jgi:hypothetical protein
MLHVSRKDIINSNIRYPNMKENHNMNHNILANTIINAYLDLKESSGLKSTLTLR